MPYQLHQKLRQSQQQASSSSSLFFLNGLPFWIWDKEIHRQQASSTKGNCCFNHVVGLPQKDKREYPMFDYEKILYDSLMSSSEELSQSTAKFRSFRDKHLWVKKATGLGVTESMLRLIAWLCTKDDHFVNGQICIVTGPNKDLAIKLIKRLKGICESKLGIYFTNKETVLELNGCQIEAYPSNHLDSFRSLTNPKFIFLDEEDMCRKGEQEDVRHVSECYIGKSDPYIVMVSTPDVPGGLFYQIENEPEETCLYKRLKLDYTFGLGKIYTEEEIDQIDKTIQLGEQFKNISVNDYTLHSVGVDFGFSSSATAIVLTEFLKEERKIRALYAEEFEKSNPQDIVDICFNLYRKHWNTWFWVDGANRERSI